MSTHEILIDKSKKISGTVKEIAILLRKAPYFYSMSQIAIKLGQTRANVSRVLQGTKYAGRLVKKRVVLTKEMFLDRTDEELATQYSLPLTAVEARRRVLKIRMRKRINLAYRQKLLAHVLFGDNYLPGENFEVAMNLLVKKVFSLENQRRLIMDFYFKETRTNPTEKVYRHDLRKRLKDYVSRHIDMQGLTQLINKKVLVKKTDV